MNRRVFLASVTASILVSPLTAKSESDRLPLVGALQPSSASEPRGGIIPFKEALAEFGWVEGRTIRFETRYGDWAPERVERAARELVRLQPDVLYTNSAVAVRALMQATSSIPIVVGAVPDLLALGGVASLSHPGGNITGVTHAQPELDGKRLEILKEAVPSASRVAVLVDPGAFTDPELSALTRVAQRLAVAILRVDVSTPAQIETSFAAMVRGRAMALLVRDAALFVRHIDLVTGLALKHRLPTICQSPGFADAGGLLQYGADVWELFRRSASHVDKILRGAKAGDLPVEQPTKISLIINLKTAKALGLTIPQSLLARADKVIE